jgi:hypothetical protein
MGKGRRIVISTSNTRKMIAIIKNRRENGIREVENGENPHSKGDVFSRSSLVFFPKTVAVIIIDSANKKMIARSVDTINISFPGLQIFSLEVRDNFYTRKE